MFHHPPVFQWHLYMHQQLSILHPLPCSPPTAYSYPPPVSFNPPPANSSPPPAPASPHTYPNTISSYIISFSMSQSSSYISSAFSSCSHTTKFSYARITSTDKQHSNYVVSKVFMQDIHYEIQCHLLDYAYVHTCYPVLLHNCDLVIRTLQLERSKQTTHM